MNRAIACLPLAVSISALACAGVSNNSAGAMGGAGGGGGVTPAGQGGNGGTPRTGAGGTGVTVDGMGGSMCGLQTFDVNRKPVEIFLVMDRSASMKDDAAGNAGTATTSKWSQVIPALSTAILQADPTISWGMKAFPEDTSNNQACDPGTVTTKIDVQIAPSNAAVLNTAVLALTDEGDGTPTAAAIRVAVKYLRDRSATDDSRKYILLATDGEPSCAGSAGALSPDTTAAHADAVTAVTEAATAGFHTFVVGVATTKATDAATLNLLAVAGLEPAGEDRPGATRFYLASNRAQLVTTLEGIVNPVASNCVFPLTSAPPVPENIAVKVNGNKTPQDKAHGNGWDYTDPAYTAVQVYGAACDLIKSNGNMVEIIFGCKDVIIP